MGVSLGVYSLAMAPKVEDDREGKRASPRTGRAESIPSPQPIKRIQQS